MKQKSKSENPARTTYAMHYSDVDDSPSFNAMRGLAQLLQMRVKRFYNRTEQKAVYVSDRVAAKLVGIKNRKTARSLIAEVVHHGFWRKVSDGYLGTNGRGVAATFQLTDEMYLGAPATLDFKRWDGTVYWTGKPREKTKPRVSGVSRPGYPEYPARVSGVSGDDEKANKNSVSENPLPGYPEYPHLDVLSMSSGPQATGGQGNEPERPEYGIGHNRGPAFGDDGLDIPAFLKREVAA